MPHHLKSIAVAGALLASTVAGVLVGSVPAAAQPVSDRWTSGTTVNVSGGIAASGGVTRPLGGGALGWEITPTLAIEGSAAWLDRGPGAQAFDTALKGQVGVRLSQHVAPFVEGGIGLYRASFRHPATALPAFYQSRVAATGPVAAEQHTFTDPAFVLGGGLNLFISRHVALRPDIETLVVRRSGASLVVTAVAVRLAYHFEEHPVTP